MRNIILRQKIFIVIIGVIALIVIGAMFIGSCNKTSLSSHISRPNSGFTSDINKLFTKWRGNDGAVVFEFTQDSMRMFDHSNTPAFIDPIKITQGTDELGKYIFTITAPDMIYTATIHVDGTKETLTLKYGNESSQFRK